MVRRSISNSPGRDVAGASLERVGVDLERQVGESRRTGPWARTVPSRRPAKMSRRDRGAALLGAHRADRPRRGAARRGAARAPARRGPRAGQGARAAARHLADLARRLVDARARTGRGSAALWIALVCALGLLAWVRGWEGRRAVARGEPRGWLARRRWRRLAARVPEPDPLRTRLFWGAEAVFAVAFAAMALLVALLARRVEHREADGHGVPRTPPTARRRSRPRTRGSPAPTSTTTTSATSRWRCSSSSRRSRRTRATTSRSPRCSRSPRRRCSRSRRRCGPRRAGSAGRSGPGWRASRSCSSPATSRARGC